MNKTLNNVRVSLVSSLVQGGASVQNCKRPSAFFWTPLSISCTLSWQRAVNVLSLNIKRGIQRSICGSLNSCFFFNNHYCVRYLTASSQFCVSPSGARYLHAAFPPSSAIEKWQQTAYEAWGLWHSRSETASSVLSQTDMPTHKLSSSGRSPVAHFSCGSSRAKTRLIPGIWKIILSFRRLSFCAEHIVFCGSASLEPLKALHEQSRLRCWNID